MRGPRDENYDKIRLPGEGAYEDRDPDMPFVFREEARKGLRRLPEKNDEQFPEVFLWDHFDPEILGCFSQPLPDGVEGAFREALPEIARQKDRFRVGIHPFWKRVCLFQKCRSRENDRDVWGVAFTFVGEVPHNDDGTPRLPDDIRALNTDGRYDAHIGLMGEFYAPRDRRDWLELAELADNQRERAKGARARKLVEIRQRAHAQRKTDLEAARHDAIVYHHHRFVAAANEIAGSMNGLPIMGTDDYGALTRTREAETHTIEQRDGYTIKTKRALSAEGHERFPRALDRRLPEFRRVEHQDARVVAHLDGLGGIHRAAPAVHRPRLREGIKTL